MKTFLLNDEFQKNFAFALVSAIILIFLADSFRGDRESVETSESSYAPVVFFQEDVTTSLVGQSIDGVEEGKNTILMIHSDNPEEWGKILADDGHGNVAIGFNRLEDVTAEVLP